MSFEIIESEEISKAIQELSIKIATGDPLKEQFAQAARENFELRHEKSEKNELVKVAEELKDLLIKCSGIIPQIDDLSQKVDRKKAEFSTKWELVYPGRTAPQFEGELTSESLLQGFSSKYNQAKVISKRYTEAQKQATLITLQERILLDAQQLPVHLNGLMKENSDLEGTLNQIAIVTDENIARLSKDMGQKAQHDNLEQELVWLDRNIVALG